MWKELLVYFLIVLCVFVFIKLGKINFFGRKILSLWQRIVISVSLTLVFVVLVLFGSVFFLFLVVFLAIMTIVALLFGGRIMWKRF